MNVKPWITPVVVFTNAFVRFGKPVKGVRVINRKFLIQTLQARQATSINVTIWTNRERIANYLTGQLPAPVQISESKDKFCPKCGKKLIEKTAKGGNQVGKRFFVRPDYPNCKTAIPIE